MTTQTPQGDSWSIKPMSEYKIPDEMVFNPVVLTSESPNFRQQQIRKTPNIRFSKDNISNGIYIASAKTIEKELKKDENNSS